MLRFRAKHERAPPPDEGDREEESGIPGCVSGNFGMAGEECRRRLLGSLAYLGRLKERGGGQPRHGIALGVTTTG